MLSIVLIWDYRGQHWKGKQNTVLKEKIKERDICDVYKIEIILSYS